MNKKTRMLPRIEVHMGAQRTARAAALRLIGAASFLLAPTLAPLTAQGQQPKDFTNIKLEDHGIEPAAPKKDPKTGFIVAGKNDTSLIKNLTEINGLTIGTLEKSMRPGA